MELQQEDLAVFKRQNMKDFVQKQLTNLILSGKMKMGEKINTEQIAKQLGVSRMPVREALQSMRQIGLVENTPYAGDRVAQVSLDSVRQLYMMRAALEPLVVYEACRRITPDEIDNVIEIERALEEECANPEPRPEVVSEINREFHFAIYNVCAMDRVLPVITMLWDNLAFCKIIYSKLSSNDPDSYRRRIEGHLRYIHLLQEGDAEQFKETYANYLDATMKDVTHVLSKYREEHPDMHE